MNGRRRAYKYIDMKAHIHHNINTTAGQETQSKHAAWMLIWLRHITLEVGIKHAPSSQRPMQSIGWLTHLPTTSTPSTALAALFTTCG